MHRNFTTIPQVNKVKILFTKRQMTAYGGFASLPPSLNGSVLQR